MFSFVSFSSLPFGPKINVYHHRVNYVADFVMIVVIEKHTILKCWWSGCSRAVLRTNDSPGCECNTTINHKHQESDKRP